MVITPGCRFCRWNTSGLHSGKEKPCHPWKCTVNGDAFATENLNVTILALYCNEMGELYHSNSSVASSKFLRENASIAFGDSCGVIQDGPLPVINGLQKTFVNGRIYIGNLGQKTTYGCPPCSSLPFSIIAVHGSGSSNESRTNGSKASRTGNGNLEARVSSKLQNKTLRGSSNSGVGKEP